MGPIISSRNFALTLTLMASLTSQLVLAQEEKPRPSETPIVPVAPSTLPVNPEETDTTPKESGPGKGQAGSLPKLTPEEIAALPPRTGAWSIGFDVRQLNITPNDRRYKQRSPAPDINVGYVHIDKNWWAMARGHLPFGPTSEKYPESPPVDYEGFGFSATYGRPLTSGLRKSSGDYGAEIGVEIFELVGRSFRRQVLPDNSISEAWVMKTSWTAITPALTATFLKPSRPEGTRPEWLMTRIEGYRISLGAVIPVQTSWDLRWEKNGVGQGDRGTWKGIFGVASVSAWLGI
ncbi:MAG: hypothetical protein EOP14_05275 [Pseudomonas sp.]|nr:MAG: hypothetical protein EOP14_05275 [Pseudomonas sp.]